MRKRQLILFKQQNCNGVPCGTYMLASWHWKWSLTWRWVITWTPHLAGRTGLHFLRVYRVNGFNFHCYLNLPLIGSFSVQTQPNMPLKSARQ